MLFTFPSQYWFAIGLSGVISLTGWSRLVHARFLVSRATQDTTTLNLTSYTGLSPSMVPLSRGFYSSNVLRYRGPTTPSQEMVWAPSLSLAATQEITFVFFSSGYLDVSVPQVPSLAGDHP